MKNSQGQIDSGPGHGNHPAGVRSHFLDNVQVADPIVLPFPLKIWTDIIVNRVVAHWDMRSHLASPFLQNRETWLGAND